MLTLGFCCIKKAAWLSLNIRMHITRSMKLPRTRMDSTHTYYIMYRRQSSDVICSSTVLKYPKPTFASNSCGGSAPVGNSRLASSSFQQLHRVKKRKQVTSILPFMSSSFWWRQLTLGVRRKRVAAVEDHKCYNRNFHRMCCVDPGWCRSDVARERDWQDIQNGIFQ